MSGAPASATFPKNARAALANPPLLKAIAHIEETLRTEFISNLSQTSRRDSHEIMAEIFTEWEPAEEPEDELDR